jgi:hypothetical protein
MRPNSGKLIKAGSSIVWDIHYHAAGEEITDTVELGLYFYSKGQEPKYRQVLASFSGIQGGNRNLARGCAATRHSRPLRRSLSALRRRRHAGDPFTAATKSVEVVQTDRAALPPK